MWVVGIIASTLFYAGLTGIPNLLSSPFWIIYTMANAIGASGSWATYKSAIDGYASDIFGLLVQTYLLPYYHYSTGFFSVLIFALFKQSALNSNLAAMSTTSTDASYTAGRNAYASTTTTGVWLGVALGVFTIIPTMVLGIITLPFTAPIVLWNLLTSVLLHLTSLSVL